MARDLTIEEIQNKYLFVRGDIEAMQTSLDKIFTKLDSIVKESGDREVAVRAVQPDIEEVRAAATTLVERLERIEKRLTPPEQKGQGEKVQVS